MPGRCAGQLAPAHGPRALFFGEAGDLPRTKSSVLLVRRFGTLVPGEVPRQAQDFQVSWKMVRTVPRVESIVIRLVPLDEPGLTRSSVLMLNRLSRPHGA